MRLMCMMALVTAIVLSVFNVATTPSYKSTDEKGRTTLVYPPRDPQSIYLIYGFLIAAFAPKAIQKFAEQKLPLYNPGLPLAQATTMVIPGTAAPVVPQQMMLSSPASSPVPVGAAMTGSVALDAIEATPASRLQILKNRGGL